MSTLQGSYFEVIPTPDEIAIIGAAVDALHHAVGLAGKRAV